MPAQGAEPWVTPPPAVLCVWLPRSHLMPAQGAEPWVTPPYAVLCVWLCRSHLMPAQGAEPWVAPVPSPTFRAENPGP